MGTATNFEQFSRNIKLRVKKFTRNTQTAVRRAAIAGSNEAISRTPVDTGRAKGNWIAAVGTPSTQPVAVDGTGAGVAAASQNRSVVGRWTLGAGPIYLNNNLPYIVPLDNGSSAQAPNGMSEFALAAMRKELRKAKLLK